ncbi:unnamed protein product [Dovyalis caffra]|uniref:Uncharacterized protein n=1 Tax=Dovyalis caffra TaxID=77055 RepID=A0AAV1SC66_9ROSI|nr:unnamed protein product [Dovyalis caffra]
MSRDADDDNRFSEDICEAFKKMRNKKVFDVEGTYLIADAWGWKWEREIKRRPLQRWSQELEVELFSEALANKKHALLKELRGTLDIRAPIRGNFNGVDVNDSGNMNVEGMNIEVVDMNTKTNGGVYEENVGIKTYLENVNIDKVDVRERMEQVSKSIKRRSIRGRIKGFGGIRGKVLMGISVRRERTHNRHDDGKHLVRR